VTKTEVAAAIRVGVRQVSREDDHGRYILGIQSVSSSLSASWRIREGAGYDGGALDKRADQIRNELEEAKKLREEAQQLLAEYQRKRKEAEAEAESILSAAEKEAAAPA
jgi:hypothetical protein